MLNNQVISLEKSSDELKAGVRAQAAETARQLMAISGVSGVVITNRQGDLFEEVGEHPAGATAAANNSSIANNIEQAGGALGLGTLNKIILVGSADAFVVSCRGDELLSIYAPAPKMAGVDRKLDKLA